MYGNFAAYINDAIKSNQNFDAIVNSGVLYHMEDPVNLLETLSKATSNIYMWTMYYDENHLRSYTWDSNKPVVTTNGYSYTIHCHTYNARGSNFFGGMKTKACWLTKEDIVGALKAFGFKRFDFKITKTEEVAHPYGPHTYFYASKE